MVKYINHIGKQNENSLVQKALNEQKKMLNDNCWLGQFKKICNSVNFKFNFENITDNDIQRLKQHLHNIYQKQWKDSITTNKKLSPVYSKIKINMNYEPYLDQIYSFKKRKHLTRFRISAHCLQIEKGRHGNLRKEKSKRLCTSCPNSIEDEYHFVINCPRYNDQRSKLFDEVNKYCPNFQLLSDENKFLYLLTAEKEICKALANYIHETLADRY